MKKLRLFLTVVVLATLSSLNVHARAVGDRFQGIKVINNQPDPAKTPDGFTYVVNSISGNTLTVYVYDTELEGEVTINPTTADSTSVYKVVRCQFMDRSRPNITKLTFPEGMESLAGLRLFSNLKKVVLPASLTVIGTIRECPLLEEIELSGGNDNHAYFKVKNNILYSKNGRTLYTIPPVPARTTIGSLDATDTSSPFYGVTTIRGNAICGQSNLTTINVPATVINIVDNFVFACPKLTAVNVHTDNPNYSSSGGLVCNKTGDSLVYIPAGVSGTLTMPATVKVLRRQSLYQLQITHLELPGVEEIEAGAISICDKLQDIKLYPCLRKIHENGAAIGNISNSGPFSRFIMEGDNPYFRVDASGDHAGILYSKDYKRLIKYPRARIITANADTLYTTHPNTEIICYGAFLWAGRTRLARVTITENVDTIDQLAFQACPALHTVTFSGTPKLRMIGGQAFSSNESLREFIVPASVETINTRAFMNCGNLKTFIVMPNSNLKTIGNYSFLGCTSLEGFQMLSPATHKAATLSVGERAFQNLDKLKYVSLGRNLSHLGTSAFGNCTSLEAIELFQGNVTTPAKLLTIGANVFQNCGLSEIQIPSSVKTIGNEAFNSCQRLESVFIPAATTSIGSQAFLFCGKLREIVVDKANPSYASSDGILLNKARTRLMQFPAGKGESEFYTMLPPTITEIADSAFYYNRGLRTVTIPRNVTRIGRYTFALCPNLEQVNLLGGATVADATAFHDMSQQTRLGSISLAVRNDDRMYYRYDNVWKQAMNASSPTVSFTDNDGNEYFPLLASDEGGVKTYDAMLLNVHESQAVTWRIPETVSRGGTSYSVKLIGDECFRADEGVCREVILPDQVNYIGIKAFQKSAAGSIPIENLFILNPSLSRENFATVRFETDETGTDYSEIPASAHVYVKKSAYGTSAFQNAIARYTSDSKTYTGTLVRQGTPEMFSYKVPGIAVKNTYGTFCREFDVDLRDYYQYSGTGKGKVWAFIAGDGKIREGAGQGGTDGAEFHVIMHSINEGATDGTDGTYVPAYTGVLLKSADGTGSTPSTANGDSEDYYYTIGELENRTVTDGNVRMVGVYTRDTVVTNADGCKYVMQGGLFRKLPAGNTVIPAHKAYLQLPAVAAGAKVMFYFGNDPVPTEIDAFGLDDVLKPEDASLVYDLQGRRVASPSKGIYVRNGKKVVIK